MAATYGIVEFHSVIRIFPMPGCKGSAWLGWQPQGRAVEPFRAESSSCGAYSARKPCRCLPRTEKASGNGNKRLTGNQKKRKERDGLQTKWDFDASSVSRPFFFLQELIATANCGQTANFAPSKKSGSGARQSVGGAVAVRQHTLDVGFKVEDFAT